MNTTITTTHAEVAKFIMNFAISYFADCRLSCTANQYVIHLELANPFLITRLQDQLIGNFHSHMFVCHHAAAA